MTHDDIQSAVEWARRTDFAGKTQEQLEKELLNWCVAVTVGQDQMKADCVRLVKDWANPLDPVHDSGLKGILNEIANHLEDL
jgi:hypothetical protein